MAKKIKILHICQAYLPYIGGSSFRLMNLLKPISNKSEMHILVTLKNINKKNIYNKKLPKYEILDNIHVHRVENLSDLRKEIKNICKKYDIDIIHAHNPRFVFYAFISFTNKPIIFDVHTIRNLSFFKSLLAYYFYKKSDRILTLSKTAKDKIIKKYKINPTKINIIYNGINFKKFVYNKDHTYVDIRKKYNISEKYIIGYIGTFYFWQGVEYLVKAIPLILQKNKNIKFLIVGGGPEFSKINNLISKLKIKNNIILPGKIQQEKIKNYLDIIDIFVIPRPKTIETETAVPLKLFEAMAAKKIIIASAVGGIEEIIKNNINGILVEPNNIQKLANRILYIIDNPSLHQKITTNAYKDVKKFTWETSAIKLMKIYENILHKN